MNNRQLPAFAVEREGSGCTISGYVRLTPFYRISVSFDKVDAGVACDLNSRIYHVLCKGTEVVGHLKPYNYREFASHSRPEGVDMSIL